VFFIADFDDAPMSKLLLKVLGGVAEFERTLTGEGQWDDIAMPLGLCFGVVQPRCACDEISVQLRYI